MRITKTGIVLCSLYLIASFSCVVFAQFIGDPKGKYIMLQMPVVLQHGLLLVLNATHLLKDMTWIAVYIVLGVPMLVFLMLAGSITEFSISRIRSGVLTRNKASHRASRLTLPNEKSKMRQ